MCLQKRGRAIRLSSKTRKLSCKARKLPASQEEDVLVVVLLAVLLVVALEGKGEEEEVRLKCALHAAMIAIKHETARQGNQR